MKTFSACRLKSSPTFFPASPKNKDWVLIAVVILIQEFNPAGMIGMMDGWSGISKPVEGPKVYSPVRLARTKPDSYRVRPRQNRNWTFARSARRRKCSVGFHV